jgi:hypothetical protein
MMTNTNRPDVFALPNVRQSNEVIDLKHYSLRALQFVDALAKERPLWTFKATGHRVFDVYQDTENLGSIGEEYYGSSMALFVRNRKIALKSERKSAYNTQDLKKALLKAKKTFSTMTVSERINAAEKEAEHVLENQAYRNHSEAREHNSKIKTSMIAYAQANLSQYVLWLKEKKDLTMLDHMSKLQTLNADMKTIEETQKAFQNDKTALVILADKKYMVKVLDNVQLYDDTTLPHELRGKLGMLKLVEKEVMVTGIGCRVNDEVFVLLMEDKDE